MPARLYSICLAFALLCGGCDDSVSPLIGEERPFSIYGYLDPTSDTQVIRVVPIVGTIQDVSLADDVDAEVRIIDTESGEVVAWQPSAVIYPDSSQGTVFTANFTPEFEKTYRIEVENSTGELVTAETTIPRRIEINSLTTGNVFRPGIFIPGDFPNLVQAGIEYEVVALQPSISGQMDPVIDVFVSYKGEQDPSNDGWEIRTNLRNDFDALRQALDDVCITTPYFTVRGARFIAFVGDDTWVPPNGAVEFDQELLVQPGTFSNVENGYGFIGSGYAVDFSIRLTTPTLVQIGYMTTRPCQVGPNFDPNDPECLDIEPCFN